MNFIKLSLISVIQSFSFLRLPYFNKSNFAAAQQNEQEIWVTIKTATDVTHRIQDISCI